MFSILSVVSVLILILNQFHTFFRFLIFLSVSGSPQLSADWLLGLGAEFEWGSAASGFASFLPEREKKKKTLSPVTSVPSTTIK